MQYENVTGNVTGTKKSEYTQNTLMKNNEQRIGKMYTELDSKAKGYIDKAVEKIVTAKTEQKKVMVVTGSGPNIHEGVTTLIAELMSKGIVDSVTTSSAVIAHEMAGSLDRVKRVPWNAFNLQFEQNEIPRGELFEVTEMQPAEIDQLKDEMILDDEIFLTAGKQSGDTIIKAAGNMAYPMGLRTENISREILSIAQTYHIPFEQVAGWGADKNTMLGAGAAAKLPVLVSVPQLIGGGAVGLSIGDSIPISERCMRIANMIDNAEVIIESAVALTQEIHDGPFECYTGHGIWAKWNGFNTCSLKGKTLVRIDVDSNLLKAKELQDSSGSIQKAINEGLPKSKLTGIPFRMEMSAFARHEGSLPIVGDIGVIWPIIAYKVAEELEINLDFISYPQQTDKGKEMREWIVSNVKPLNRQKILGKAQNYKILT
jgi:hypothetical protein